MIELSSVPLDGSARPVTISRLHPLQRHLASPTLGHPFDDFVGEFTRDFQLSPDASRVVFTTQEWIAPCGLGYDGLECAGRVLRLFSAPVDGSAPPELLFSGGLSDPRISPDGSHVVFLADLDDDGQGFELDSVPIDGSRPAVRLHGPLAAGGSIVQFESSHDGARVVFRGDPSGSGGRL